MAQLLFTPLYRLNQKLFSDKLTLLENSDMNLIIDGTVDGEGSIREPKYIVHNGVLKSFISGCRSSDTGDVIEGTGSAYRFDHRVPPRVQPSKIATLGDKQLDWIISNYQDIAVINDLDGITESLDPLSTRFNAYADATIYANNVPIYNISLKIKTSITEILNEIVEISNDGCYGADGSIFSGSFLVNNNDLASSV